MSELSYLEKLLDGVEVEWRNLGDTSLFEIANNGRKPVKASLRIAGETPYYGANNIQDYVDGYTHDGEYVLIAEDGSASLENYSIQYATGKFWANNHVHVVRGKERVHSRFLYHYLCIVNFLPFLTGGGRAKLTKGQLIEIPVPIPCPDNPEKSLAIQSEIVRILDKFTALTAELTAELNMRKKQYNYYRDRLFSFGAHDVKRLKLGELCVIGDGLHGTPEYDANGDYFFINGNNLGYQKISFNDNTKKVNDSMFKKHGIHFDPINTVFLSINGTIGNVSFYNNEKIVLGKSVAYFKIKSPELHTRYLFYFLQTNYAKQYFENQKTGSTIKNLGLKSLRAFEIPIPSYDEQLYIVATMDKFYNLTNSITEGLPREIELRQKQYEYYRDLLFSFPKPETVSN
ncbi:restriction endonuclease subunit S [Escherichia coli]|uniref:Restriction endonuclease subunit S n=1 Tax=Escherichia coli TaxID=562 RepID=A0A6N9S254_ECOLX|nr:restriction endonuclease subunit S [Escherichia coli]EFX9212786.1 restriction endonuclease subunit S [Shigella sonnei]EFB2764101.1 restriction endonuclease subunit S [Escherichia coli]EFD7677048.1 restriction endonuclease subunit S [Escherichia coli]EFE8167527.1 restriction endonuclease subunit S [Escherichia coli]EFM0214848.1 restriction endonuclease subunit S [Escherichia coli]